jgi:hypothetical protein
VSESRHVRRRDFLSATGLVGVALWVPGAFAARDAGGAVMNAAARDWHQHPYRIVQINLREPDIREDPVRIVRQIKEFGANVLITSVGGIVAFYPTELEYHYRNRYMAAGQDFIQEIIDAARTEQLAVVGRFDFTKAMRAAYEAHPEWFARNQDGTPRVFADTYQACPNGGWSRDYSTLILKEALSRYDLDGVFFNLGGYQLTNYANVYLGPCQCQNCKHRFREMYDLDLPKQGGFSDPTWPQYLQFQERTLTEQMEKHRALIKGLRPRTILFGRGLDIDVVRGELQRRVERAPPEWGYQSGEQSRELQAAAPGRSFSAASTAHVDFPWRQTLESAAVHMTRFAQQLGTGANLDLYLMGTLDDQDDRRFEAPVSQLFKWHERNSAHYDGLVPAARVAIYSSMRTRRWSGGVPSGKHCTSSWRGAYTALVDRRIPFWFVSDERIADGTTSLSPESLDVIILPHIVILTDQEAEALDRYVEAGGVLIATGQTGAFDALGQQRSAIALRSSPITRYEDTVDCHGWTFDAARASVIALDDARIPATGNYYRAATVADARNLLPRAPDQPLGPPEMSYAPEGAAMGREPGILMRVFGKGVCIHIPWAPDAHYYRDGLPDHAGIFVALIEHFAPPAPVKLSGNGPVELMVMRQATTRRLLVHVVNYSGQRNGLYAEPARIQGLRVGVRGGGRAKSLVTGHAVTASAADAHGYRWYELAAVDYFEALCIASDEGAPDAKKKRHNA